MHVAKKDVLSKIQKALIYTYLKYFYNDKTTFTLCSNINYGEY